MTVYSVTINGNTYTSDNNPTTGMGAGGYRTRFLTAIADVVAVASQVAANAAAAAIPASGKQVSTTPTANQIPCVDATGKLVLPGGASLGNVSNASPTVLDWYEEGTITSSVSLTFGNASTGIGYSVKSGYYTRIGNVVAFQIIVLLTSKGTATGTAEITGLPYAAATYASLSCGYCGGFSSGITAPPVPAITSGNSKISLYKFSAGNSSPMSDSDFGNTSYIWIGGSYLV